MAFNYNGLWKKLIDENMKKTDLQNNIGLSAATVAKLGKNETVNMKILARICDYFGCGLDDIVSYIPNENKKRKE